jgi:WD40 repeat protein
MQRIAVLFCLGLFTAIAAGTADGQDKGVNRDVRDLSGDEPGAPGKEQIAGQISDEDRNVPRLMLDTGGHQGVIKSLAFTPDDKFIVSAGDDKVIRIWDWQAGKTVRAIRGWSGSGPEGMIYAMALSPDGRWLAVGGFLGTKAIGKKPRIEEDAFRVRLYDFASGELRVLLKGHTGNVMSLAFSHDSKLLISGAGRGDFGAIIWDVDQAKPLHRLTGHRDFVNAVGFTPDGLRAITGSRDATLRLWSAMDGTLLKEMTSHGSAVNTLAISPKDGPIASGDGSGEIRLWDAATGSLLKVLAKPGGSIRSLHFSPDGQSLLFACGGKAAVRRGAILDLASGKELTADTKYDDPLTASAYSSSGRIVATAGGEQREIHVWDPVIGEVKAVLKGTGREVWSAAFAADGRRIAWGTAWKQATTNDRGLLELTLRLPAAGETLTAPEAITGTEGWLKAKASLGTLLLQHKKGGKEGYTRNDGVLDILNDGKLLASIERGPTDGYGHYAYSLTPDGGTVISGACCGFLTIYALDGTDIGEFAGHEGTVWAVAPSPDGKYLLSGSSDQTVRLWNLKTRELIVSLFHGSDGEWVMWTPQGYYASSPNGDRIVGWQINKGPDRAAEYVAASQLRTQFYRPDIVERAIALASASKAIEESGQTRKGSFQLSDLTKRLPPKLSVLSPSNGEETMRGLATISLALAENKDDPVKTLDVFVNENKVTAAATRDGDKVGFEVPLSQGANHIRIVARSKLGLLGETTLEIQQNGEGALDKRDTLFIIAIGVDKYPNVPNWCGPHKDASCDLSFAGADARVFTETVEKQMGGRHLRVEKRVLFNGAGGSMEPARDNIENVFDLLLQAKDNDTVAVFIAGHGYNDPRIGYQFLPTNTQPGDSGNWASSSVIKWTALEGAIEAAKGRRLLFVDTCHSGSAFNARLIKDATDGGIVAYSATNMQQEALELPSLGHGIFTNVLVKGLNGGADPGQEREVRVFDLAAFVEREVRKLTNGRQTPDFYKKPGADNFVLVRM